MIPIKADKLPNMHSTNYRGLPVIVQWPKGSIRVGTRKDGSPFKTEMKADYGYIPGTEAAGDEERLDIYIGPDKDAETAYAIEQLTDEGDFDEYKVMLGFDSLEDAEAMYLAHNDDDWEDDHVGDISEIPFDYLFDMVSKNQETVGEKTAGADEWRKGDKVVYIGPRGSVALYSGGFEVGTPFTISHVRRGPDGRIIWIEAETADGTSGRFTVNQLRKDTGKKTARFLQIEDTRAIGRGEKTPEEVMQGGYLAVDGEPIDDVLAKLPSKRTVIDSFLKNYEHEVDFYQECASLAQDKLDQALQEAGIKAVVSSRAKRPSRLGKKLLQRDGTHHYQTFRDIYDDIVDLAGVRVALYMPADRPAVGEIIRGLFVPVREPKHFPDDRGPGDSLGYVADHYLVRMKPEALRKKELRYADTQIEIQVASVLMHAWAEVTHDLIYKPEKGQLTSGEMSLLKDLNGLVQEGERQLERLQTAIEGRTDEDLRFDITAALGRLSEPATLTMSDFMAHASKIAGVKSPWASMLNARVAFFRRKGDALDDRLRAEFAKSPLPPPAAGPDDPYMQAAIGQVAPGKRSQELSKEELHAVLTIADRLKNEAK